MTFSESISTCFSKYATFSGRASRSEFWWFYLFMLIIDFAGLVALVIATKLNLGMDWIFGIGSLATVIPHIAVTSRRLHDTNKSGWWQLLVLTIIGTFLLIYWCVKESDKGKNRFDEKTDVLQKDFIQNTNFEPEPDDLEKLGITIDGDKYFFQDKSYENKEDAIRYAKQYADYQKKLKFPFPTGSRP